MSPHFFVLLVLTYSLATRTVWNTINDRYSSFALLSNVATFLVLIVLTYSLVIRAVWNTIDERYSSFALLSNVATFLGFAGFDIFSCH